MQVGMGKFVQYATVWLNNKTGISSGVNYTFTDADYQRCHNAASYVDWMGESHLTEGGHAAATH
jgi:hypothetical protein